jgi:hypothetical protein
MARTRAIVLALGSRYGRPYQGFDSDFVTCAQDPDTCMQMPDRRIEFAWRWPDGHRINLVTKANHPYPPLTMVTYGVAAPSIVPSQDQTEQDPSSPSAAKATNGDNDGAATQQSAKDQAAREPQ